MSKKISLVGLSSLFIGVILLVGAQAQAASFESVRESYEKGGLLFTIPCFFVR